MKRKDLEQLLAYLMIGLSILIGFLVLINVNRIQVRGFKYGMVLLGGLCFLINFKTFKQKRLMVSLLTFMGILIVWGMIGIVNRNLKTFSDLEGLIATTAGIILFYLSLKNASQFNKALKYFAWGLAPLALINVFNLIVPKSVDFSLFSTSNFYTYTWIFMLGYFYALSQLLTRGPRDKKGLLLFSIYSITIIAQMWKPQIFSVAMGSLLMITIILMGIFKARKSRTVLVTIFTIGFFFLGYHLINSYTGGYYHQKIAQRFFKSSSYELSIPELYQQSLERETDLSGSRYELWRIALNDFLENPVIGKGIGPKVEFLYYNQAETRGVHNLYLYSLVALGIVGNFFLIIALWPIISAWLRNLRICDQWIVARLTCIGLAFSLACYNLVGLSISHWSMAIITAFSVAGLLRLESGHLYE